MTRPLTRLDRSAASAAAEATALTSMAVEIREIDRHLEAIAQSTDKAANALIDVAEKLAGHTKWLPPVERDAFNSEIAAILQFSAFGDLFGQRLSRSQASLWRLADHVDTMRGQRAERQAGRGVPQCLSQTALDGPQAPGEALDQESIDAYFR
jgi:ABC-type transporter Mla subunit MlaD